MITLELEADKVRFLNANIAKSKPRRTRAISKEVREMVIGELPVGMNSEIETDKMWEELAK